MYSMIERCREAFPVRIMCDRLGVSPSGYYEWWARLPSARAQVNERLLARIQTRYAARDGVLGRRRIHEDLCDEGVSVGANRVGRLCGGLVRMVFHSEGADGARRPSHGLGKSVITWNLTPGPMSRTRSGSRISPSYA